MPIYEYKHSETGETRDIILSVGQRDSFKGDNGKDENWERQVSRANFTVDPSSTVDPFSKRDFQKVTSNKNGTVGDLMELSEELSEKRADKNGGVDPVQAKHYKDYEKKTGKKHQDDRIKVIEKSGVRIEMDD
tara:strand:+ start:329 stop:727 length:399 start_codon:yes stop_codon:yes gene_type:complete